MSTKIVPVKVSGSYFVRDTLLPSGLVTTNNTNQVSLLAFNRFDGVSNPNWRMQVKARTNAGTTASGYKSKNSLPSFWAVKRTVSDVYESRGVCGMSSAYDIGVTIPSNAADSRARVKFLQNYLNSRQSFQSGVFLGELRETLHMIRHPALAFRKGLDVYHGAVKERLRRITNERVKKSIVGGTWLEYSFGWTPLISDIKSGMKALAETLSGKYVSNILSSQDSDDLGFQTNFVDTPLIGGLGLKAVTQFHTVVTVRYKGGLYSGISYYPGSIRENWGITWSQIVPTIWELIPYSFLVDYFSNLGDVLTVMSNGPVSLAWGNKTVRMERSGICKVSVTGGQGSASDGSTSLVAFVRQPINLVSAGLSDLQFKVPGFGSKKWLNIGALALLKR
jgi:hypothetical protein